MFGWVAARLLSARRGSPEPTLSPGQAATFKEVTELTLFVFLVTGAVLSFERLSQGAGTLYAAILVGKIMVSVAAYQLAFRWRRAGLRASAADGGYVLGLGALAMLLAALLKGVFERGLRGAL